MIFLLCGVIGSSLSWSLEWFWGIIEPLTVGILKIVFAGVYVVGYVYLAEEDMGLLRLNLGLLKGLHGSRGGFDGLIPIDDHADDSDSNTDPLQNHDFFSGFGVMI